MRPARCIAICFLHHTRVSYANFKSARTTIASDQGTRTYNAPDKNECVAGYLNHYQRTRRYASAHYKGTQWRRIPIVIMLRTIHSRMFSISCNYVLTNRTLFLSHILHKIQWKCYVHNNTLLYCYIGRRVFCTLKHTTFGSAIEL